MQNKYKEGQILRLRDGRLVYLHHDEGSDNRLYKEEPKWPGHFTAYFYVPGTPITYADWSIFSEDYNPDYQGAEILCEEGHYDSILDREFIMGAKPFLDKCKEKRAEINRQREMKYGPVEA
jgi:hypothetical protein